MITNIALIYLSCLSRLLGCNLHGLLLSLRQQDYHLINIPSQVRLPRFLAKLGRGPPFISTENYNFLSTLLMPVNCARQSCKICKRLNLTCTHDTVGKYVYQPASSDPLPPTTSLSSVGQMRIAGPNERSGNCTCMQEQTKRSLRHRRPPWYPWPGPWTLGSGTTA